MWIIVCFPTHLHELALSHPAMDVMKEETFGPVVGIMKVESDEEALGLMNDSPYGLVRLSFHLPIPGTDKR